MSIPKWKTFRKTCNIACVCISPSGVPNTNTDPSSFSAIAGFGVRRGRLPGATPEGWRGSGRDWTPRVDIISPVPGTTGHAQFPSEGVAEIALPHLSIAHRYVVSPPRGAGVTPAVDSLRGTVFK